jgi:GH24 family phage-related lysozyme (muramidase)
MLQCGFCLKPANGMTLDPMHPSTALYDVMEKAEGNNGVGWLYSNCDSTHTKSCHYSPRSDTYGLYQDSVGACTRGLGILIGSAHACTPADLTAYHNLYSHGQDHAHARTEMETKINTRYVNTVNSEIKVQLTQYQYDALVDLSYNGGPAITGPKPNYALKALIPDINTGHCDPAKIIGDWKHLGGQVESRRTMELNMFNHDIYRAP